MQKTNSLIEVFKKLLINNFCHFSRLFVPKMFPILENKLI